MSWKLGSRGIHPSPRLVSDAAVGIHTDKVGTGEYGNVSQKMSINDSKNLENFWVSVSEVPVVIAVKSGFGDVALGGNLYACGASLCAMADGFDCPRKHFSEFSISV
jgi:hypothetical protein